MPGFHERQLFLIGGLIIDMVVGGFAGGGVCPEVHGARHLQQNNDKEQGEVDYVVGIAFTEG